MHTINQRKYVPDKTHNMTPSTITLDRRLSEVFGEELIIRWNNVNPENISYHQYELSEGFLLINETDLPEHASTEVLESYDPVNFPSDELDLFTIGAFNPLRYNVHRSYSGRKYYRIGKSGKVLVLRSGEELRQDFLSVA
ncbi:MAG TPA: hypothetical protein DEP18_08990 [Flavobacteriales bacterium]|nr:hypothetical protein [Flavobacteriales bacterium]